MWDEAVPEVEWEVWVDSAESSDEVILPSADRTLGSVTAMQMGGHELKIYIFVSHEFLQKSTALIVKALEFGA